MTSSPEGCGVDQHPVECLCDVVITNPITADYPIIPYQVNAGVALAVYGRWDGTLIHWLDLTRYAWGIIHEHRTRERLMQERPDLMQRPTTIPPEAYMYLRERVKQGAMPKEVLAEMLDKFDVTISKSYVSHTRARMKERGEL
jgi:hypothetical protein